MPPTRSGSLMGRTERQRDKQKSALGGTLNMAGPRLLVFIACKYLCSSYQKSKFRIGFLSLKCFHLFYLFFWLWLNVIRWVRNAIGVASDSWRHKYGQVHMQKIIRKTDKKIRKKTYFRPKIKHNLLWSDWSICLNAKLKFELIR